MGELSKEIGEKLERFGNGLFQNLGWKLLAQNLEFDCDRTSHKNPKTKTDKKTHGIDLLFEYYNPFAKRKEVVIVECKNHLWDDYIPSNLSAWLEELVNTIECASASPKLTEYLKDKVLTTGILLFNSSDNKYESARALNAITKATVPARKSPSIIFNADTSQLEKIYALNQKIGQIKLENTQHNFRIIYPSIGGSRGGSDTVITPSYLFSDYIITEYRKLKHENDGIKYIDVKNIFCFDSINNDSLMYLIDMINKLQVEAYNSGANQETHICFYPQLASDIDIINHFAQQEEYKDRFIFEILDNRRLSRVDY